MSRSKRPNEAPSRKQFPRRTLHIGGGGSLKLTVPHDLEREPFPYESGTEVTPILVTDEEGYQHLEIHADPEDLEGEPAHEQALGDR